MKAIVVLLFAVCYVQCRKTYQPLDKNANLAFINMEGSGLRPPSPAKPAAPVNPAVQPVAPATQKPTPPVVTQKPVTTATQKPQSPAPAVTPPVPTPQKPVTSPIQIKPVPVNPKPVVNPIPTPGPGSVKQLVNFYDSQGKASPIRPYSYSTAVKQG